MIARGIYPVMIRGAMFWQFGGVYFATLREAICAAAAAEAHRLDVIDTQGGEA